MVKVFGIHNIIIDSNGNFIAQKTEFKNQKLIREVNKYSRDSNYISTLASSNFVNIYSGKVNPFRLLIFCRLSIKDHKYYADPDSCEIKIFNKRGDLIGRILKEYSPAKVTERDKDEFLSKMPNVGDILKTKN